MNSTDSDIDKLEALLSEVRGESQSFDRSDWAGWSDTLGEWVEAYPAFGAGRLLRAITVLHDLVLLKLFGPCDFIWRLRPFGMTHGQNIDVDR